MKRLFTWEWQKLYMPPEVARKNGTIVKVLNVKLSDPDKHLDLNALRNHSTVLITGDAKCLSQDLKEFESWDVPHDLYAVNRSLVFHQRQVDHWAAVDVEEAMWFTENVNPKIESSKPITRHCIGGEKATDNCLGISIYDVYWLMDYPWENEYQKRVFVGNTGYFAVLTAINMGYEKIVLAGMPLDRTAHWYEQEVEEGPNWSGLTYTQWIDFKMLHPHADRVRSVSGYSAFILGQANKEWASSQVPPQDSVS